MVGKGQIALVVLTIATVAFLGGRTTAPQREVKCRPSVTELLPCDRSAPPGNAVTNRAGSTSQVDSSANVAENQAPKPPPPNNLLATAAKAAELVTCKAELVHAQTQFRDILREQRIANGEPIAPRTDVPPRFQEHPLLQAVQGAFKATGITGRIDTVDCVEFPCIIYGRVNGDEEVVAKLEDAKPLSVYDNDIGVMLTWSSGDQLRGSGTAKTTNRSKPSEISLFAFAFYSAADKAKFGESLDRRIRSRTAELWNELRPEDP